MRPNDTLRKKALRIWRTPYRADIFDWAARDTLVTRSTDWRTSVTSCVSDALNT
jgi:hypothetical protein